MAETQDFQIRLEKLERANKRWRAATLASLLVIGLGMSIGADRKAGDTNAVVQARRFELYKDGRLIGEWEAGSLHQMDADGKVRAQFSALGVSTWDTAGQTTYAQIGHAVAVLKAGELKQRVVITDSRVGVIDDNNKTRAYLDQNGVTVAGVKVDPAVEKEFAIDPDKVKPTQAPTRTPPKK